MRLVLQTADVAGAETNCLYPNRAEVSTPEDLREAVKMDHVCGEYEKNYRSIKNFLRTNVVVMDIDNDHSENPEDWNTPRSVIRPFRTGNCPPSGTAPRSFTTRSW